MKKNQTDIISILFSSLLMLPLLLVIILQLWQLHLNHTAHKRIEKETVRTIVIKDEDVVWKEAGREVTIKGEYFDLISWSLKDGVYTFTGIYDKEETAVSNMLEKQNASGNFIIRLLIIGQCFASIVFFLVNFSIFSRFKKQLSFFSNHYKYLFLRIIVHPPRNVSFAEVR